MQNSTRVVSPGIGFLLSITVKNRKITTWLAFAVVIGLALIWAFGLAERGEDSDARRDSLVGSDSVPEAREAVSAAGPQSAVNRAWEVLDPETVDELPEYKEVVPGRALVRISDSLSGWQEGDEVLLEIPQLGGSFDGLVERMDEDLWGNTSYTGLLKEANGRDYRFVITVGPENVFAQLGTSRGTFELVASNEMGWLMPSSNMDQHVDYSQPDYYIVEERTPDDG